LFIHGIGGAKYDRITDLLIRRYFGCAPPEMACVTATLHLDLAVEPPNPPRSKELRHHLRDVRYNTERYIPNKGEIQQQLDSKRLALTESVKRRGHPGTRSARRQLFLKVQAINAQLEQRAEPLKQSWGNEIAALERSDARWRIAKNREYFIGLFPPRALQEFVSKFP